MNASHPLFAVFEKARKILRREEFGNHQAINIDTSHPDLFISDIVELQHNDYYGVNEDGFVRAKLTSMNAANLPITQPNWLGYFVPDTNNDDNFDDTLHVFITMVKEHLFAFVFDSERECRVFVLPNGETNMFMYTLDCLQATVKANNWYNFKAGDLLLQIGKRMLAVRNQPPRAALDAKYSCFNLDDNAEVCALFLMLMAFVDDWVDTSEAIHRLRCTSPWLDVVDTQVKKQFNGMVNDWLACYIDTTRVTIKPQQ